VDQQQPVVGAILPPDLAKRYQETQRKVKDFQEGGSVFDSPLIGIARRLAKLLPIEADQSDLINPMGGPAVAAVSAFMKPARKLNLPERLLSKIGLEPKWVPRVPDVEAREIATSKAAGQARAVMELLGADPKDASDAAMWMRDRYPRVSAHVDQLGMGPNDWMNRKGKNDAPDKAIWAFQRESPKHPKLSEIYFNMEHGDPKTMGNTLAHELTHVAQNVGHKNLPKSYTEANKLFGYASNPFEISADFTANKHFPLPEGSAAGRTPEKYIPAEKALKFAKREPGKKDLLLEILGRR
jgi:hypothetical protein